LITIDLLIVRFRRQASCAQSRLNFKLGCVQKKENWVRMMPAFALTLAASGALADDVEDAHKLALQGANPTGIASRKYSQSDPGAGRRRLS
jgi:hypothetical protein